MKNTNKMVFMALLVAQALVLYIFEGMIPVPFITPGAKLGLSNIVTVIALYTLSYKETFIIIFLRILLSTMFGGSLSSFMYSVAGALLSYIIMIIVKTVGKNKVSIIGVSSSGAVFHNIGQLLMAAMIVQNIGVMLYLPILTIAGVGTGIFVGITSNYATKHLSKIKYLKGISQ
ncbi:Gx transporter family protein [Clostridium sp. MSJ-4]|uniref:Gx transporter family protein n=1 Tax=Clostridium simiarum TaxID=2841506 RepID=A0ABS6EWA4_9CLOT|nr:MULTISPECIES: Gx transporter family protein [Clostridium]MBU5590268.1 Gx transporter family protein [Clostridium simiarum]